MPDGADYIANYRMFGRKISSFYHFSRYQQQNRHIYQGDDHAAVLGKVWFRNYEETAAENRKLFSKFIEALKAEGMTPILIVPPYYMNGIDTTSKDAVQKKKDRFYHIVRDTAETLKIFDYMDIYSDRRDLFADLTHLNSKGAEAFTCHINQKVLIDT